MLPHVYTHLSAVFPERVIQATSRLMTQGGLDQLSARVLLGFSLFLTLAVGSLTFFLTPFLTRQTLWHSAAPALAMAVTALLIYLVLIMKADARAQKIEEMLPNALQIMSSNIRAGMTVENALWNAARPEFGALSDEIRRVAARVFGGQPVQDALQDMTQRVRSSFLQRSVQLVKEGILLGGRMAPLLDSVAADIRAQQMLRKEIATSTLTYSIFIVFAAVVAAPLLFAVTTTYSQINENVLSKQHKTGTVDPAALQKTGLSALPGLGGSAKASITTSDIQSFAYAALSVTAIFAALILGLIRQGKATAGLTWIPVFLLISLGLYTLSYGVLGSALKILIQ